MPLADGSYGDRVTIEMPEADFAYLSDLWQRIDRLPPGGDRSVLVNELRVHLDMRALLPGGGFVDVAPPVAAPAPPSYVDADQGELFDLEAGRRQARSGMARALSAKTEWRELAEDWLDGLPHGGSVTADDLVAAVGLPAGSVPEANNALGGFFSAAAKRRRLVFTGRYQPSRRPERHGNQVRVWQVVRVAVSA